jgi:hypothetical protein
MFPVVTGRYLIRVLDAYLGAAAADHTESAKATPQNGRSAAKFCSFRPVLESGIYALTAQEPVWSGTTDSNKYLAETPAKLPCDALRSSDFSMEFSHTSGHSQVPERCR